jgi:hypothetical protein
MNRARAYLVLFGLIYTVCFCFALPAYIDEAYSYNLITDSSLAHMLSALRDGADGAFPVYPVFAFGWEKLFGSSELSLRLTGGLFVILFVWQWSTCALRHMQLRAIVVGLAFMLANEKFIFYTIQTRFYGLVILLFSILFWSTWEMLQRKEVGGSRRLWHGLACGLLCLSHPLGIVYTGILGLLYVGLSCFRKAFSLANAASFLGGPLLLLAWLPSFLVQRQMNSVFAPGATVPGWRKYWEYAFLDSKALFAAVLIGTGLLAGSRWLRQPREKSQTGEREAALPGDEANHADNTLLLVYAMAFIVLLNVTVVLLDATRVVPVFLMCAVRYVLVVIVAYGVIVARIWEGLEAVIESTRNSQRAPAVGRVVWVLVLTGLLAGMATSWSGWFLEKSYMESTLAKLAAIAREKGLGIICEDHESAFFLAQRAGAMDVKYVLAESFPSKILMRRIAKHYHRPIPITAAEFRQTTNDFILLPSGSPPVVIHRSGASGSQAQQR